MKRIGIIGGMSAHSTLLYCERLIAETARQRGGLHSPDLMVRFVDFAPIADMQAEGQWQDMGRVLGEAARDLERGGAEVVILATNTMHKVADAVTGAVSIPFIHVGDATAEALKSAGCSRPGLIGTAFTMRERFYVDRLADHGLSVVLPDDLAQQRIHEIIYEELCKGVVRDGSRATYLQIVDQLADAGADSLSLGCTEVGLLLNADNVSLAVFDTTLIHADAALSFALAGAANTMRATGTHG